MRIFFSELASNPAQYAFGYSVYGLLEDGDDLSDIFSQGFQPFVGAREIERMVYMSRGVRVRTRDFTPRKKVRALQRSYEAVHGLSVRDYRWDAYPEKQKAFHFISDYFSWRHGAASMPQERLRAILAYAADLHLVEYRIRGEIAGYSIEIHSGNSVYMWYIAYARAHRRNLGSIIVCDVISRAKGSGGTYAYLGASYGPNAMYKAKFQPLEYWNGNAWVAINSLELRRLLKDDPLRVVAIQDEWRKLQGDFYEPHPYGSIYEIRLLASMLLASPRVVATLVIFLLLCAAALSLSALP